MSHDAQPMKIFVDCHVFDGFYQGSRTYIQGIYSEFIKDGSKHFYMASANPEILARTFGAHPNVTFLKYRSGNKFFRLLVDIPQMIKKHHIDFAHFQYVVPFVKNCRFVTTTHDILFMDFPQYFPLPYRIKNRLLFQWSAKRSDVLVTVSDYSRERLETHFGKRPIAVTPNAVDAEFFQPYDQAQARETVKSKFGLDNYWIFVSRREPRKNHLTLLKAFAGKSFHKDYQLVLVGESAIPDPEFDAYYNTLDETVKSKIVLLGRVSFTDMQSLLKGAALSVYPSLAEGFGIPPLESLALGIPTICSNTTAMADFTFLAENQFDPESLEDLALKACKALKETDTRLKAEKMRKTYNWAASANILRRALETA